MAFENAQDPDNAPRNRYRDVLPYDKTRVELKTGLYDYINASNVTIPITDNLNYKYIATQGPLRSTSEDFWRLVWEQQCSVIAMTTNLTENGKEKCFCYWPTGSGTTETHGPFELKLLHEEQRSVRLICVSSARSSLNS
jgi:protein tyrosine phosphatase